VLRCSAGKLVDGLDGLGLDIGHVVTEKSHKRKHRKGAVSAFQQCDRGSNNHIEEDNVLQQQPQEDKVLQQQPQEV
jgi:hypothetical protein